VTARFAKLVLGVHFGPPFWGMRGLKRSAMVPFERVSYRLSIVTTALSLTIRPQFAVDCIDAQINREWVTLGQNFWSKKLTNVSQSLTLVERHVIVAAVCKDLMLFEHNTRANYYWTLIEIVISDDQWRLEVISANANHLSSNDDANQSTGIVKILQFWSPVAPEP